MRRRSERSSSKARSIRQSTRQSDGARRRIRLQGRSNFNSDLETSTGTFFDGVYSDWFKLQTIALMAVNPDATAWYYADSDNQGITQVVAPRMLATVRRNFYLQTASQYFQSYYLFFVPSYVSDSDAAKREGLNYNALHAYSWYKRVSLAGAVGTDSDYNWVVLKNNPTSTWEDAFGNALMGCPNSTDGNLNLNRDVLYDSGIFPVKTASDY